MCRMVVGQWLRNTCITKPNMLYSLENGLNNRKYTSQSNIFHEKLVVILKESCLLHVTELYKN